VKGVAFLEKKRGFTLFLFLLLSFLWGSSFPIIKIGLNYAPPFLYVGIRCLLAGIIMVMIASILEGKPHFRKTWHIFVICSLFNVTLFQGLHGVALLYLPSGLTAVIIYLQPVFTCILAWIWLKELMPLTKIIGLLIGFVGVISVSLEGISGIISPLGIGLALGASICWAMGTVYFKYAQEKVPVLWLVGLQFLLGGMILLPVGTVFENWNEISWNLEFWLTTIYTSLFSISLAWVIWLNLIREGEAGRVSAYTFLTPLVAILIGVLFLGESFTIYLAVGAILIILSIYLVNRLPKTNKVSVIKAEKSQYL
jgi:O-acetylserine/cysteine efflux transporter